LDLKERNCQINRDIYKEELHDLYPLPIGVRLIKNKEAAIDWTHTSHVCVMFTLFKVAVLFADYVGSNERW
jgi:hypothetical protein